MIKISVEATVLHLMVDDKATLALKLSDGTYVDFPIYDEAFPLVKAGKKFRLTLEEVESQSDGSSKLPSPECLESQSYTIPDHVAEMYMNSVKVIDYNTFYPDEEFVDEAKKPYPNNEWVVENSKCDGKTPYHILDELRRDVAALGTIKKALNQLEVRNDARLASYPDPEIEAHRKHIQEVIMPEAKKVEGMITGTAGEVDEAVNKGPFCDWCKHIGVNPESGPCALCFEGMMYESDKAVLPLDNDTVVNPDEEFKVPEYLIHQRVGIPGERLLYKDEKPLSKSKGNLDV